MRFIYLIITFCLITACNVGADKQDKKKAYEHINTGLIAYSNCSEKEINKQFDSLQQQYDCYLKVATEQEKVSTGSELDLLIIYMSRYLGGEEKYKFILRDYVDKKVKNTEYPNALTKSVDDVFKENEKVDRSNFL